MSKDELEDAFKAGYTAGAGAVMEAEQAGVGDPPPPTAEEAFNEWRNALGAGGRGRD